MATPERPYGYQEPHPETARLELEGPLTTYAPRERRSVSWLRSPVAPGLNPRRPVVRDHDRLVLGAPFPEVFQSVGMVDAEHHFSVATTTPGGSGFATDFRVSRGEDVLWETDLLPGGMSGGVSLPTGSEDTYRMTFDVANHAAWGRLSTRSRTEWTFRSARTESPTPVPLLTLGYGLGVDLHNELARRNGANEVAVTVGHQAGVEVPVDRMTFEVSYDDGGRWRHLRTVRRGDGRYVVELDTNPPRDARFVSFRVDAQDADGNRIVQEIIRAAALPHGR
jgi:hypothetical protein